MKKTTPALKALVKILNDLQFHSGSDLGEKLNISRNAVWKHMSQLLKYGIEIESLQGTGYRLKAPLILLDEVEIQRLIAAKHPIDLEVFGSIASTNDQFQGKPQCDNLQFCMTEHQTKGRGRFGRAWVSPFGANIILSCRWPLRRDPSELGGLSLCVSLAILATLKEFGMEECLCKWPNDIVYRGQKLAGVLIEVRGESHGLTEAIIGIGLNVNMQEKEGDAIEQAWTSLQKILGSSQDRNLIAALLIKNVSQYLERFSEKGFADFKAEWAKYNYLKDRTIELKIGSDSVAGIVRGVNDLGHLLLETESGGIHVYSAGDTSIKK